MTISIRELRERLEHGLEMEEIVPARDLATISWSEALALVEAVEAAHAYYAVDWDGESEERLARALAAFSFGDGDEPT